MARDLADRLSTLNLLRGGSGFRCCRPEKRHLTARAHRWTALRVGSVLSLAVSSLVLNALPAITGVLARGLGLEPAMLGSFASANSVGGVIGGALAIALMRRAAPRVSVMIGLTLLLIANLASAAIGLAGVIVLLRAVGGVGTGITISACYYVFGLQDRERNIAASLLAQTASTFLVFSLLPPTVNLFGWRAMFIGLALLVLPCLLLAREFPDTYNEEKSPESSGATGVTTHPGILALGLVSVALCSVAILCIWTYLERIGASSGIPQRSIGTALSICTFSGFISSAIALRMGERISGTGIVFVCVFLYIVGIAATTSPIPWIYTVAISAFYFSLPIYLAAQFGSIMRRASSGRFAAQYALAGKAGALGPAIGGLVVEQYGLFAVRWLSIVLMAVATALLWLCFVRTGTDRRVSSLTRSTP